MFLTFPMLAQKKENQAFNLPPAVEKVVAQQSQGATIRGFSAEKENDQTLYEAELVVNGHSKDVLIDANGAVMVVEEQVAMDALPALLREALQATAGKGQLLKVEVLTKQGKLVAYEAKVVTNGRRSEVQVRPNGKPLDHEQ
jgi:uncharacterized membrane protein YkoI